MREIDALKREKEDRERQLEMENATLKDEANQVRNELEAIMRELQSVLNTKMSLELEIAAYRKLLESEENRSVKHWSEHCSITLQHLDAVSPVIMP